MNTKTARLKADLMKISEAEAIEILRYKLKEEGNLVVGQVGNSTGGRHRRTADGLIVQTWPSRGLTLTGVEYKRDRADWRRELRNGQKAEEIAAYCHYWLLLAPKGVIPLEEVPGGWGLYEINKTEKSTILLRTKPPPPKLDPPKPLDYGFLAAILRAREKYQPDEAKIELEVDRRDEIRKNQFDARVQQRTRDYERLKRQVEAFENASGIQIENNWGLERLAEGLATFLKDPDQFRERLRRDRSQLVRMIELTDEILDEKGRGE